MTVTHKAASTSRTRFRTFSLRSGLIAFVVLCVAFGFVGRWIYEVRERGDAQRRFIERYASEPRRSGVYGDSIYAKEAKIDDFTAFIRARVHPEYERKFKYVSASGALIEKEPRIDLARFFGVEQLQLISTANSRTLLDAFQTPGLQQLTILFRNKEEVGTAIDWSLVAKAQALQALEIELLGESDLLLVELGKLPKLQHVKVTGCTPEGFVELAKAPSLMDLSLSLQLLGAPRKATYSDEELERIRRSLKAAFDELGKRPKLTKLSITGRLPITSFELAEFCATSKLKELHLRNVFISSDCLGKFVKLPNLASLEIDDKLLQDKHLEFLDGAKNLKLLTVGPEISGEAIQNLRKKLPECEIWRK